MKSIDFINSCSAKRFVQLFMIVLCFLQLTILTAFAGTKEVYIRWGTDNNWNGDGGSVTSSGKTVTNKNKTTFTENTTITFRITPSSGYVIEKVEWSTANDGFSYGTGTVLTPTGSNNEVSFQLTENSSFQVRFAPASGEQRKIVAYYGTGVIDETGKTTPNWDGGQVFRVRRDHTNPTTLGTTSYSTYGYNDSYEDHIKITPDTGPDYYIAAVKYAEASWSNPNNITVIGTPVSVTPDSNGYFELPTTSPKNYVVFVQFLPVGSVGGKVGAWYGTNNTSDIDSPSTADGNGGTVYKTSPGTLQMANRVADTATRTTNGNITIEARPDSGFQIVKINYKLVGGSSWTPVTLGTDPTAVHSFNIAVSGGQSYVVWVVYSSTASLTHTVTGTVSTDATTVSCGTSTITPQSLLVNHNSYAGPFTFSTSSTCVVDTVTLNGTTTTNGISGNSYTTADRINSDTTFVVKFKPVGYKINAYIDPASPSGAGTITPATVGTTQIDVAQGGRQSFVITPNAGYSVSHVYVTDTNRNYSNTDIAPLTSYTYTFENVQANGEIKVSFSTSSPVAGNDYCQVPPFVQGQTNLSPNVLIIFDNSGSMAFSYGEAYKGKSYNCTSSHNTTTNKCNTIFEGYFDPYKMYKVDSSNSNVYMIDTVTLDMSSTNGKSGNYLNYKNMAKVDIVRKILVGGRVTGKGTSTLAGRGTTATKYLYTDNGKYVEFGTGEPVGIIQNMEGRVRFGLEVLGSSSDSKREGGKIVAKLGSSKATLVTAIEGSNTDPVTNTPMAEALYEAIRYFQAKPSAYNSGVDYGDSTWNPTGTGTVGPIIQYACQKHFVLMLTDGEPNSNDNLPGLSSEPSLNGYSDGVFDVAAWENKITANDRADTTNSTCNLISYNNGVSNNTNSEKLEAVSFYAHNTDLRSTAYGNDMPGTQNLTIYPVYAFGNGAGTKTLHMVAKYGAYESKNGADAGSSPNKYPSPDLAKEWDKDGNCIPDAYFEGDDSAALEKGINDVISNILAKVASGTAASILSNSEGSGANLLQAVFYPNKIFGLGTEANWIGEMQNLWYYVDPFVNNSTVREDTDYSTTTPSHILNVKNDYVTNFIFDGSQTTVTLSQDTNGDGTGETVVSSGVDPDDVKSLWRAGKQLWLKDAVDRTIYTSINGLSLLSGGFTVDNKLNLDDYLQVATNDSGAEATSLINYIRGIDDIAKYRNRTVSILTTAPSTYTTKTWKLGDIIASTPKLQSSVKMNNYDAASPAGYGDYSYKKYVATSNYKNRGMVYVGANDGMFHAFKLGTLTVSGAGITGDTKATLTGANLGEEQWAYVPRNALPYLKYYSDRTSYNHLYYVDGPTLLADVAIGGCSEADYANCVKDTTNGSNWRTVVIGSMGLGGASKFKDDTCLAGDSTGLCVKTPIYDPTDTASPKTKGIGYSSYFAFDVTNQYFNSSTGVLENPPIFKWEFSDPRMGYATSGATIVKINAKETVTVNGVSVVREHPEKNGKWFAVFASGPTGPIDGTTHQFMAKSNQNLKFFVIDLGATIDSTTGFVENTNYWVLDSGIANAFGGTIINSVVDTDRWNKGAAGNYEDDVLYVGYTNANTAGTEWTNGGIVRILTKGSSNPAEWGVSQVVKDVGPVTTSISKLQDRKTKKMWLYFGSGRYYYGGDDTASYRHLVGVKDGCYTVNNTIDKNCNTTSGVGMPLTLTDLTNQSNTCSASPTSGWYVKLRGANTSDSMSAERVITDPVALTSGTVYYTSFSPTSDVCSFGGTSYMWALKFDTGCLPLCSAINGKGLLQMSTGSFQEVNFSDIFSCTLPNGSTKSATVTSLLPTLSDGSTPPAPKQPAGSASDYVAPPSPPMPGKPPGPPPAILDPFGNAPLKKVIHIQEK